MSTSKIIALSFEVDDLGKYMKSSKKRYTWQFKINASSHKVELEYSYLSGKRLVKHNGLVLHQSVQTIKQAFQFPFKIGSNSANIIQQGNNFELRINNQVFSHLYTYQKTKEMFQYEEKNEDENNYANNGESDEEKKEEDTSNKWGAIQTKQPETKQKVEVKIGKKKQQTDNELKNMQQQFQSFNLSLNDNNTKSKAQNANMFSDFSQFGGNDKTNDFSDFGTFNQNTNQNQEDFSSFDFKPKQQDDNLLDLMDDPEGQQQYTQKQTQEQKQNDFTDFDFAPTTTSQHTQQTTTNTNTNDFFDDFNSFPVQNVQQQQPQQSFPVIQQQQPQPQQIIPQQKVEDDDLFAGFPGQQNNNNQSNNQQPIEIVYKKKEDPTPTNKLPDFQQSDDLLNAFDLDLKGEQQKRAEQQKTEQQKQQIQQSKNNNNNEDLLFF